MSDSYSSGSESGSELSSTISSSLSSYFPEEPTTATAFSQGGTRLAAANHQNGNVQSGVVPANRMMSSASSDGHSFADDDEHVFLTTTTTPAAKGALHVDNMSLHNSDGYDLDNLSVTDFNAPMTREDAALMNEIMEEERRSNEMESSASSRQALFLGSPILMAATASVASSTNNNNNNTKGVSKLYFPPDAPTPESSLRGGGGGRRNRANSNSVYGSEWSEEKTDEISGPLLATKPLHYQGDDGDIDMDAAFHEDDLQFGVRSEAAPSGLLPVPFTDVDEYPLQPEANRPGKGQVYNQNRRRLYIAGWVLVVAFIGTAIALVIVRLGDDDPTASPVNSLQPISFRPTNFPAFTPAPSPRTTALPAPNVILTDSPTSEPVQGPSTPSPTRAPVPDPTTLSPTSTPTILPNPTGLPSPNPSDYPLPTAFPTTQPLPVFVPTTNMPSTSIVPPTIAPTFSDEENTRRADIASMMFRISGDTIANPSSAQYKALQWIMDEDPLHLSATSTPAIVQRYVLATLYYSTNLDNTWIICGVPGGTTTCPTDQQRYLSEFYECGWLGTKCSDGISISTIDLSQNGLRGELPQEISEFTALESLILSRNSLTSTIPTQLGRLSQLRFGVLNQNALTGTIPTELGTLLKIWYLHLGGNQLTGTIPTQIFVASMQHVNLGYNNLYGTIPTALFDQSPDLINIDIGNNRISGSIPEALGTLRLVSSFTAENNTLTGSLLGSVFTDTMTLFDVSQNSLTGSIPSELFDIGTSLTLLNLGNNTFQGTISSRFGELGNLQQLGLWYNNFTGTIPSSMGSLTILQVLHFGETQLGGTMPSEVCALTSDLLRILSADCAGNPPELECSCCSLCFPTN